MSSKWKQCDTPLLTAAVIFGVVNAIICLIFASEEEELLKMATLVTVHWDCIEVGILWMGVRSHLDLLLVQSPIL